MGSSPFAPPALADYLARVHGARVANVRVTPMGGGRQGDKGYGYGVPLRVDYELDGRPRRAVLESVRPGPFGHEHMADRAPRLAVERVIDAQRNAVAVALVALAAAAERRQAHVAHRTAVHRAEVRGERLRRERAHR